MKYCRPITRFGGHNVYFSVLVFYYDTDDVDETVSPDNTRLIPTLSVFTNVLYFIFGYV